MGAMRRSWIFDGDLQRDFKGGELLQKYTSSK